MVPAADPKVVNTAGMAVERLFQVLTALHGALAAEAFVIRPGIEPLERMTYLPNATRGAPLADLVDSFHAATAGSHAPTPNTWLAGLARETRPLPSAPGPGRPHDPYTVRWSRERGLPLTGRHARGRGPPGGPDEHREENGKRRVRKGMWHACAVAMARSCRSVVRKDLREAPFESDCPAGIPSHRSNEQRNSLISARWSITARRSLHGVFAPELAACLSSGRRSKPVTVVVVREGFRIPEAAGPPGGRYTSMPSGFP